MRLAVGRARVTRHRRADRYRISRAATLQPAARAGGGVYPHRRSGDWRAFPSESPPVRTCF